MLLVVVAASPCAPPMAATGTNRIAAPVAYVWVRLSKEQTQMSEPTVNVPLLRKAVEFVEAEAAKPIGLSEWAQEWWVASRPEVKSQMLMEERAPECGTCYCVAGFIAASTLAAGESISELGDYVVHRDGGQEFVMSRAERVLGSSGWSDEGSLFAPLNSAADVRRIAESIAGERL